MSPIRVSFVALLCTLSVVAKLKEPFRVEIEENVGLGSLFTSSKPVFYKLVKATSVFIKLRTSHRAKQTQLTRSRDTYTAIVTLLLILASDIEVNPGPSAAMCGTCDQPVTWDHKGILCDDCETWFHAPMPKCWLSDIWCTSRAWKLYLALLKLW